MGATERGADIRIDLLGRFRVTTGANVVAEDAWPSRRAAELVALLALAAGRRLTREQVIEALWPTLEPEAGAANLRKAAHHARQALDSPDAVVLKGGQVTLFPGARVETDADRFEAQARAALSDADEAPCTAAIDAYGGDLLPSASYEEWTQAAREHLRAQYLELLRRTGRWEQLAQVEPTDEEAHRMLMRRELAAGRHPAALRWYGRLRTSLRRELGIAPGDETRTLYDECVAGLGIAGPELIGREVELAGATAVLRSADRLGALAVRGPAGIGKTAFCRELADVARADGWTVVVVAATEAVTPYEPIASAVEQLAARDRGLLEAIGSRPRSVLAELTTLAGPAEPLDRPLTRHEAIGSVRRLLVAAAGEGPIALIVDDTHLADEATIDLLLHLGALTGPPVLPVLAYRQEPVREELARGVERLVRGGRAVVIELGPLDRDDARALVAAGAPTARTPEVVDRIVELGQGNPFLTLETARSAVAGVPALLATARAAITARFIDLDEHRTAMLARLAVAGDTLDPTSVVALTGASEKEAFALLDLALHSGVLIVAGERYRFGHELVRQALVEQIPPHQRLGVHRETASRLADAGAPPGAIARHWLDGGRPDEAVGWLMAAARQAFGLGAYRDALTHLALLVEHRPDHSEALSLRAEALDALGDPAAPEAYAAAARAVGEPDAHELRAKQALASIKLGDPAAGLEVLAAVEPQTVEGRLAHALALCGAAALGFADPAIGAPKAAEARRLAMQTGDRSSLVIASWAHAAAAHARGDLREAVLADLRETHALPQLAVSVFDGQLCITQRFLYGARPYEDVIAFADSLAAEADRLGAARGRAFAVTIRGEAKLLAGRLDDAATDLEAGVGLHREIAAATGEAFAVQRRAEVELYRGRREDAVALLDEALAVARESDVGFHLFDRIYGARILAASEPDAALAALEEAESAVRGPIETCPGCRITLAVPAAIAAARARDAERADYWLRTSEYLAGVVMRLPAWDAALEEIRGHRARDRASAAKHFRAAAAGFAAAGQPLDAQRCAALATS